MGYAIVGYQIATYSGAITVNCSDNDENDVIFAKAKRMLSRNAPLPFGIESFWIEERQYDS